MVGRPFEKGQPRPPNSGRKKGTPSKPKSVREHIERRRAQREAALAQLYDKNPTRALEIEAQMLRDDVTMLRYEPTAADRTAAGMSDAQAAKLARDQGPISDDECTKAYASMVQGDTDEARVIAARIALSERDQLPGVLRDCRALRKAVAAGRFRVQAEVTAAQLVRALAAHVPVEAVSRPTVERTDDAWRHAGIPLEGGARLIPATPPQLQRVAERLAERYADPPHVPPPIDAEPIDAESPAPAPRKPAPAYDPWSDDRVTIVPGGGFGRR